MMRCIIRLKNHHIFVFKHIPLPVLYYLLTLLIGVFWRLKEIPDLQVLPDLLDQQGRPDQQGLQALRVLIQQ